VQSQPLGRQNFHSFFPDYPVGRPYQALEGKEVASSRKKKVPDERKSDVIKAELQ
jgi:hypothetical protein